ncbi:alginate lyase family protein [Puniceicoccaceae bacterium K14]|nr:alginate lyase family protein [Puniceicoccaceae bacterium K14]
MRVLNFLTFALIGSVAWANANSDSPRVFMLNPDNLAKVQENASNPNYLYADDLKELYDTADNIIEKGQVYSVTDTDHLPPSGDIHDYFSLSPYWWPDPSKADGLPYIRHDGKTNPERDEVSDRKPIEAMIEEVGYLSRAYYFSGDEQYAAFASRLIKTWFLEEETKMNPNINHGQMIRGRNLGKAGGIIGTRRFCLLIDSIGLLEGSSSWTDTDDQALQTWMQDFLDWLLAHPFGETERSSANNHGTSYDMQVISLALYTDRINLVKTILDYYTIERIYSQIKTDGAQPEELERTKGWNYCVENIKYFFRIARMVSHIDKDITLIKGEDSGSMKDAIDFLLPYTTKENNWPYQQITAWEPERFAETLHIAYAIYGDKEMKKTLKSIGWKTPKLEEFINIPN